MGRLVGLIQWAVNLTESGMARDLSRDAPSRSGQLGVAHQRSATPSWLSDPNLLGD